MRFRLPLDRALLKRGLLDLGDSLFCYLPWDFAPERLHFVDVAGQPITCRLSRISEKVETPFGRADGDRWHTDLGDWLRGHKASARDHLLVTIVDWEQGAFALEREPFSQHDPAQRAARNRLLADIFYELLESAKYEQIFAHQAVPAAYCRLPDKGGYSPDGWVAVGAADERLYTDGWQAVRGEVDLPGVFQPRQGGDPAV